MSRKQRAAAALVGRTNVEKKRGIFNPEFDRSKQAAKIGRQTKARGVGIFAPGVQSAANKLANHTRWHLNRGVVRADICAFCAGAETIADI